MSRKPPRRFVVPEVVQTSAMDCGPASLKSLLQGFGVSASYGRLREACQTDVDGTSIDTLEEIAVQLGLEAEQVMLPLDHLLREEVGALPAIVVVRLPNGFTHFVVAWSRVAGRVQVMDPATGRRWPTRAAFLREAYIHRTAVPAAAFREYAGTEPFLAPLRQRLSTVAGERTARGAVLAALRDPGWLSLAQLDAATRMLEALVGSGGLGRGGEAASVLDELLERLRSAKSPYEVVPADYWFAHGEPARAAAADASTDAGAAAEPDEEVVLRGVVLVQVRGVRARGSERAAASSAGAGEPAVPAPLSPELALALAEPPLRPLRELARTFREDGLLAPTAILFGVVLAGLGVVLEAVLFRFLFDLGRKLTVTDQRVGAAGALVAFLVVLVLLEAPIASGGLRMGRRLEGRYRIEFLRKIPRLADRYFQSRPISDMAERSHGVHTLRGLPALGVQIARAGFLLVFTTAGIAWLDPRSGALAVGVALVSVALPLALLRTLTERDLRVRDHAGSLSRSYLDALLGLVPLRAHGAERAMRREHESLLVEWVHASRARDRLAVGLEVAQAILGFGLTAWLFLAFYARGGEPGSALLLLYWAFSLPTHGQALAVRLRQLPALRNTALRLLEPLGAMEQAPDGGSAGTRQGVGGEGREAEERPPAPPLPLAACPLPHGISLRFANTLVRAGGHPILEGIDLQIPAGAHVAIVGPSGAGKSSLVGLLLGWHRAASGGVWVGGEPLSGARLEALRCQTAWVDPSVQLWNRSVMDNLLYGASAGSEGAIGQIVEQADLHSLLETLPEGLATELGEGGGLVSGGEGQRVRYGRAALRQSARLVILDEPFRGLDRDTRRRLLARARAWWKDATLLCITHDVGETLGFERVIVIEGGRVVEDGRPSELSARPGSRYAVMLAAEEQVRSSLWGGPMWRRLRLGAGTIVEPPGQARAEDGRREEAPR